MAGRMRRTGALIGVAACAAAWAATSASAGVVTTVTIGANSPTNGPTTCSVTPPTGGGIVLHDTSYTVPTGGGRITSFAFQNDGTNDGIQLDFLVIRPIQGGGYMVVGGTGLETLGSDALLDTFTPSVPIVTAPSDQIAFFLRSNSDTALTTLNHCFLTTTGTTGGARNPVTHQATDGTLLSDFTTVPLDLNLSAQLDQSTQTELYGGGMTSANPQNGFTVTALTDGGGELQYTDGTDRTFDGDVDCVDLVDNAATIVAHDPATGLKDRTQLQDNGPSGDKLINLLWNPAKVTKKSDTANSTCTAPNTTKLARAAALAGDPIHIGGPPSA